MKGPINLTKSTKIIGFSQEEKVHYQREVGIMCLTGKIICHAPLVEFSEQLKKEITDGLSLKKDTLNKKISKLENPTFILLYKD